MAVLAFEGSFPILYGTYPVPVGSTIVQGYLARPDNAGTFPAVLLLHDISGITGTEKDLARRLARKGYVTLAVDLYRGRRSPADLDAAIAAYTATTDQAALLAIDEGYQFLQSEDIPWTAKPDVAVVGLDVGGSFRPALRLRQSGGPVGGGGIHTAGGRRRSGPSTRRGDPPARRSRSSVCSAPTTRRYRWRALTSLLNLHRVGSGCSTRAPGMISSIRTQPRTMEARQTTPRPGCSSFSGRPCPSPRLPQPVEGPHQGPLVVSRPSRRRLRTHDVHHSAANDARHTRGGSHPPGGRRHAPSPTRSPWPRRLLISALVVANLGVFAVLWYVRSLNSTFEEAVTRDDAVVSELAPTQAVLDPRVFLLIGSDTREDLPEDFGGIRQFRRAACRRDHDGACRPGERHRPDPEHPPRHDGGDRGTWNRQDQCRIRLRRGAA